MYVLGKRHFDIILVKRSERKILKSEIAAFTSNSVEEIDVKLNRYAVISESIEVITPSRDLDSITLGDKIRIPQDIKYYCLGEIEEDFVDDFGFTYTVRSYKPCCKELTKNPSDRFFIPFCPRHLKTYPAKYYLISMLPLKKLKEMYRAGGYDFYVRTAVYCLIFHQKFKVGTCSASYERFIHRLAEQQHESATIITSRDNILSAKEDENEISRNSLFGQKIVSEKIFPHSSFEVSSQRLVKQILAEKVILKVTNGLAEPIEVFRVDPFIDPKDIEGKK